MRPKRVRQNHPLPFLSLSLSLSLVFFLPPLLPAYLSISPLAKPGTHDRTIESTFKQALPPHLSRRTVCRVFWSPLAYFARCEPSEKYTTSDNKYTLNKHYIRMVKSQSVPYIGVLSVYFNVTLIFTFSFDYVTVVTFTLQRPFLYLLTYPEWAGMSKCCLSNPVCLM